MSFSCCNIQPNTVAFLKSNNFDFNKSFLHGISSIRRNDEKRLLDEIMNNEARHKSEDHIEITGNNAKVVNNNLARVDQFISFLSICLVIDSKLDRYHSERI